MEDEIESKDQFELTGERPLPARLEVGLYRIAQEALTNVARHAQARWAEVRLIITPATVQLTIEDNGRGFDPDRVPLDHHGLIGMQERARLLGGTLELRSQPDRGYAPASYDPALEGSHAH